MKFKEKQKDKLINAYMSRSYTIQESFAIKEKPNNKTVIIY